LLWVGFWLAPRHRQQCRDVMHHRLQALSDRAESSQAQEIHRCGAQGCHHSSAVAAVAVVVLVELGVTDPVPALDAPTLSCQSQQGFWGGAQAGDEPVNGLERLAITGARGDHFRNPAGAMPVRLDVVRRFFGSEIPGDVAPVADLLIACHERDLALSKQLVGDLPVEALLVGLDRQQEVGPLLRELPKNACCVWSASAWMSTPSRSSSPSSFWSTARSWFSPVA
jgi:hypothetical protein